MYKSWEVFWASINISTLPIMYQSVMVSEQAIMSSKWVCGLHS